MEVNNKVFRANGIVSFLKTESTKKSPVHFGDNLMRKFAEYIKAQHFSRSAKEVQDEAEVVFYMEEKTAPGNDNNPEGGGFVALSGRA